jgi:threonine dehydrogenase-like Zn-dependent dehydrogenase
VVYDTLASNVLLLRRQIQSHYFVGERDVDAANLGIKTLVEIFESNDQRTSSNLTMSAYESFAIVGAGTLGILIIEALAAKNVSLVVLSRPGSATKTVPPSVKTVLVDYDDAAAVTAVLEENKVDVVISTVAYEGLASQNSLVDAAKLAGVKLFVPSEFGFPTDGLTQGVLGAKGRFAG